MRYFGDSYDIVKRFLLHTLDPEGNWAALPMFSEEVAADQVTQFEAFLAVRVLRPRPVPVGNERCAYFDVQLEERRILVDPNTGISMAPTARGKLTANYVSSDELIRLCVGEPRRLVVVFDQSHPRGAERESLRRKIDAFEQQGLSGFAYSSHTGFVVLSATESVSTAARNRLTLSGLPGERIVVRL